MSEATQRTIELIRDELIPRLEAGEYEHTSGCLRESEHTFCAVGALIQVAVEKGILEDRWYITKEGHYAFSGRFGGLDEESSRTLGVTDLVGITIEGNGGYYNTLTAINDSSAFSDHPWDKVIRILRRVVDPDDNMTLRVREGW